MARSERLRGFDELADTFRPHHAADHQDDALTWDEAQFPARVRYLRLRYGGRGVVHDVNHGLRQEDSAGSGDAVIQKELEIVLIPEPEPIAPAAAQPIQRQEHRPKRPRPE